MIAIVLATIEPGVILAVHAVLECFETPAKGAPELRKFPGIKEQDDEEDDQKMAGT